MAEATKKFRLQLITPQRIVYDEQVDMVIMETVDGQIGVMAGHEPVATVLGLGALKIENDFNTEYYAVFGGFVDISQSDVVVLADICEKADEIDQARAAAAKARAEERVKDSSASIDMMRAQAAMRRALVRLELGAMPAAKPRGE